MILCIYDGECYTCNLFKKIVELIDIKRKIRFIEFENDFSQQILEIQFGEKNIGFSLYLFFDNKVYWGNNATFKILEILGFPKSFSKKFSEIYPKIVEIVSKIERRHRIVEEPRCKRYYEKYYVFAKINKKIEKVLNNVKKI